MTHREAYDAITKEIRALLMKHGFSRRGLAWYRHDRRFLQMIDVRIGEHVVAVTLGAMYRPLNRDTHPTDYECHISIGLGSVVSRSICWRSIRAYREWMSQTDDRIKEFVKVIRETAMPVLDTWRSEESICQFLNSSIGARSTVRLELTKHLAKSVGFEAGGTSFSK